MTSRLSLEGTAKVCEEGTAKKTSLVETAVSDNHDIHAPLPKIKKYYDSLKFKKICPVKDDGHSLIYAVINCMFECNTDSHSFNPKDIIQELREEIEKNCKEYFMFLQSDIEIHTQLQLFEDEIYYDVEICHTLLQALSNRLNVDIVVVERALETSEHGMTKIVQVVEPNCPADERSPRRTFFLFRTSTHYDALVNHGKSNYDKTNQFP